MMYNKKTIKVYNSAFILLLRSLKVDKHLAMYKYAKVAVQATLMEQAYRSKEAEVPQVRLQNLQPSFLPKRSSSSKTLEDAESEGLLRKVKENGQHKKLNKREEKKKMKKILKRTERPITIQILQRQRRRIRKQKIDKTTAAEDELLKNKFTNKGPAWFGSVKNLKWE